MHDLTIKNKLLELEASEKAHLDFAKKTMEADGSNIFVFDLFINTIYKRSLLIIFGFTSLIRENNFLAAAPLVRIHVDTLLRLSASSYVDDPHKFAMQVFDGTQIKTIKDASGKK